jgi:GTPase
MASIFTYDPDPPRVSSPWSISGSSTPHLNLPGAAGFENVRSNTETVEFNRLADYGISKLEPEPQEGPTEYKLHILLRPRRPFISMSTGQVVAGNYDFKNTIPKPSSSTVSLSDLEALTSPKSSTPSALYSRQQRLQQLTTQLLWRLQQSSPFHSSSTANLVLPVLPEATPKLGLPQKPSRLLPGLEESQGALYEIGVADAGTFVGLLKEELDESLNNLRGMAASLGCKVEVLRKVVVGTCEWTEDADTTKVHSEELWVAEALVSPDLDYYNHQSTRDLDLENLSLDDSAPAPKEEIKLDGSCSHTEQIRVSITGPSAAGKSSLLGTLTTSALDNGRGKSRLSLLKHRHEISSGITSSVAQELIGYRNLPSTAEGSADVINYASGNVTAWNDIHAASDGGRVAFVSDLPGLPRYMKSTLRGLISWAPHYVFLCIPANSSHDTTAAQDDGEQAPEIDICLAYLDLCIRLETPLIVAITKLDLASRLGLKQTLARVLSTMKAAEKKPLMLAVAGEDSSQNIHKISTADCNEALKTVNAVNGDWSSTIPILLTSAVNGSGIGKFHALLRHLPLPQTPSSRLVRPPRLQRRQRIPTDVFDIDEVFAIPPSKVYSSFDTSRSDTKGVVLCGIVRHGSISVGDELVVGPIVVETKPEDNTNTPHGSRPRSLQDRPYKSRTPSGELSPFSPGSFSGKSRFLSHAEWQRVRVVSVRNLRLSVRILLEDQVGTIGVEPIPWGPGKDVNTLGRLRKGMILAQAKISPDHPETSSIPSCLAFSTAFVATFPARDFSTPGAPPLILGGVVVVYIGNIRAAAKVTCVALADDADVDAPTGPLLEEPDFFNFDDDDDKDKQRQNRPRRVRPESEKTIDVSSAHANGYVNITFGFISSIEWVEVGSLVVVMPGVTTTTSATGDPIALSGLEGYVGRLVEVSSSEDMSER